MKILLISPPFYRILGFYNRYFPIGITSLGTVLKNAGHDVVVYNADYNHKPLYIDYAHLPARYPIYLDALNNNQNAVWVEIENIIKEIKPDIIGISVFTTFVASAFKIASLCKKITPSCPVVMGGPHATVRAEEILQITKDVDYVIRGEGEESLIELISSIENKNRSLTEIKGLSYRYGSSLKHNPSRERIKDLDQFPFPDRALLLNEAEYTSEDMGLIMSSRGCPYSCAYCATDTKRVSYRSVDSVIKEMIHVKKRYGTTQFTFKDDSFTVHGNRVKELCNKLIDVNLKVKWECNTRVNLINEDLLKIMKRAGCNFIKVGIESGSERVLQEMNKGISLNQIKNAACLLNKSGIHWTGYFMMGVPGETIDDIRKTIHLLNEIKPDLALIGVYEPFPGTRMFEEGQRRGLVKSHMTMTDYLTTLPNHYYKLDSHRQVDTISEDEFARLEKEVKRLFHAYNNSISNVIKMALSKARVYIKEPMIFFSDIKKYVGYISSKA